MRFALIPFLLAALAVAKGADTLTYPDLVHRLTDMEGLAVLPPTGEKTALASSYDRGSQYDAKNDKYINWGANGDGGGVVREEGDTVVLADIKGPGCIWRIWSAAPRGGHVKIYLDGSTTPSIDLPFKDYFDRERGPFPWKNLAYFAAGESPALNEPGASIYVPISFAKSCKITGDKQKGPDEQTGWGAYYQFNYTTFPEGTVVPTFKLPFAPEDKAALDQTDVKLGQCGQDPAGSRAGEKTESKALTLEPSASSIALDLQGSGAITALKIKVPLNQDLDEEKKMLLRQLTIRITWDGEAKPAVWSPVGDFFATIGGAQPFATLPVGLQPDGTFYCYWYMPYGKSAKIELGNDGPDKVPVTVAITHAPLTKPIANLARFHAKWHRDQFQPTRADRWPDWNFLTTQGRGRFVGMMLHAFVPVNIWWGEGDEKFFVDGEKFPSDIGTGTEDYFGYAWGAEAQFARPYHAQPLNERNCNHVDDIRWHIAENVPFQTGFEADLEKYLYNDPMSVSKYPNGDTPKSSDPHALYAAEAYWYLAPGGTDPYGPLPLAERTTYWSTWAKINEPGVIEGEWLKGAAPADDRAFCHLPWPRPTQDFAPDMFSGNRVLCWGTDWGPQGKEKMETDFPVKKSGRYKVIVHLGKGPKAPIVLPTFEDKDYPAIDCYAPQYGVTDLDLGEHDLAAGMHPLEFMIAGSNPAGSQKFLELLIDYMKLVPIAETKPRHVRATGANDSSIHSVEVGDPHPVPHNNGDTWDLAWTPQGSLYSPSNDSNGFPEGSKGGRPIQFNKIIGEDPTNLDGKTVNTMDDYDFKASEDGDNCSWKSSGCASIDGVLYWLIARHQYGGDQTVDYDKRQLAHGASFIKSTDLGKTWTRAKQKENVEHPMFPGRRFAAPYFIQYGQDGYEAWADGSDKYVYALSNNGFWDNGDWVVLGRCLRAKMSDLKGSDWEFYVKGDGASDAAWTSNVREAQAVLCKPDHLGMTRAVYLPKHECYFMIGWYYPAGGGKLEQSDTGTEAAHSTTNWDFYVAAHPWGPWHVVGSHTWKPQGYYCPGICPKFNSADESIIWAFTAGDWRNGDAYKLTAVPLTLK